MVVRLFYLPFKIYIMSETFTDGAGTNHFPTLNTKLGHEHSNRISLFDSLW